MAVSTEETGSLELIAVPAIEKRILVVRDRQVMLDEDLADLYGVETRVLVQQVRRTEADDRPCESRRWRRVALLFNIN